MLSYSSFFFFFCLLHHFLTKISQEKKNMCGLSQCLKPRVEKKDADALGSKEIANL